MVCYAWHKLFCWWEFDMERYRNEKTNPPIPNKLTRCRPPGLSRTQFACNAIWFASYMTQIISRYKQILCICQSGVSMVGADALAPARRQCAPVHLQPSWWCELANESYYALNCFFPTLFDMLMGEDFSKVAVDFLSQRMAHLGDVSIRDGHEQTACCKTFNSPQLSVFNGCLREFFWKYFLHINNIPVECRHRKHCRNIFWCAICVMILGFFST